MPIIGTRSYSLKLLPGGQALGDNGNIGNDEFVAAEIGQVGTQFDGLGHVRAEMIMSDGSKERVFYNGFTGEDIYAQGGLVELGVENIKPILTKGILLDIAGYKGVERLDSNYEITVSDVEGVLSMQGLSTEDNAFGDAILFRTGYGALWYDNPDLYNSDCPGIGVDVAKWLVDLKITVTGGDTYSTEISTNPDPSLLGPVHQELMTKNGIFNIENLYLEELVEKIFINFYLSQRQLDTKLLLAHHLGHWQFIKI